jgi:hypothetical protein
MRCVRKLLTLFLQKVVHIDTATLEAASSHVCVRYTRYNIAVQYVRVKDN